MTMGSNSREKKVVPHDDPNLQNTLGSTEPHHKQRLSQSSSSIGILDKGFCNALSPSPSSIASTLQSSSNPVASGAPFVPPDNNFVGLVPATNCPSAHYHADGYLCHECRAIRMGWGSTLPMIRDSMDNLITVGPEGSILEEVHLHDNGGIAVLSVVVYLNVKGLLYTSLPGFTEIMKKYPYSVAAGERISSIYQSIERIALPQIEADIITFDYTVEQMLMHPEWRTDLTIRSLFGELLKNRDFTEENRAENFPPFRDDPELHGIVRPPRSHNETHRPVPLADWVFSEGTDMTRASVGKPEPQKWFIVREDCNDPSIVDVREYPEIRNFDWHDKNDINSLNKYRDQVFSRTSKREGTRRPWTLLEKEAMKRIIQSHLQAGNIINTNSFWDTVTKRMDEQFKDAVQDVGKPLAQSSKFIKGKWGFPYAKNPVLTHRLIGPAYRTPGACKSQAAKYHDIATMLGIPTRGSDHARARTDGDSSSKSSLTKKRKMVEGGVKEQPQSNIDVDEDSEIEEISVTQFETSKKERRKLNAYHQKDSANGTSRFNMPPPPPPPPPSAGSLAS